MKAFNENTYYDELLANNIASEETLNVVTDINGYSIETLNDVLYAVTGYRDWYQYCESTNTKNIFE